MINENGKRTLRNTVVYWKIDDPEPLSNQEGMVKLTDLDNDPGDEYALSDGGCWSHIREASFYSRQTYALIIAIKLIHNYGIDHNVVHNAMLDLYEYRYGLPDDTQGLYKFLQERYPDEFEERYRRYAVR